MLVAGLRQPELVEDVPDMPLDSLPAECEALGDSGIGHALCHQREHFPFSVAQLIEPTGAPLPGHQPTDDGWVDH